MKTHAVFSVVLLTLVSGSAGYLLRAQKTDGSSVLQATDVMREEYLSPPDTFSRVENTKHALESLCTLLCLGIDESTVAYDQLVRNGETSSGRAAIVLERALREAETGEREFEGTEQQLHVLRAHLRLLASAGRFDRWTEIYLRALHDNPTHPVVSGFANEAVRISRLAGRENEVLDQLRYVADSPTNFAGRASIAAALNSVQLCFTRVDGAPENFGLSVSGYAELLR